MINKTELLFIIPIVMLLSKSWFNLLTSNAPILFWATDILVFVIIPFAALFILYKKHDIKPLSYGLFYRRPSYIYSKMFFIQDTFLTIVMFFLVYEIVGKVLIFLLPNEESDSIYSARLEEFSSLAYIALKIYLSVTAGVVEEVFFRGVIYKVLSDRIRNQRILIKVYVLVSSLLFMLLHYGYSPAGLSIIFTLGVVASILYLKIKKLEPLIIAHIMLDMVYL